MASEQTWHDCPDCGACVTGTDPAMCCGNCEVRWRRELAALEAVARAAEEAHHAWEVADRDASERPAMDALDAALQALKEVRSWRTAKRVPIATHRGSCWRQRTSSTLSWGMLTVADLQDRVHDTLAWARIRIEWCRREEAKFGAGSIAIEAATERRALVAVVRMLTGKDDA